MSKAETVSPTEEWKKQRDGFISACFPRLQSDLDAAIHTNHEAGETSASVERESSHNAYAYYRDLLYYAEEIYQQLGFVVMRKHSDNSYFDREKACTVQPTEHKFELHVTWDAGQ